MADWTLKIVSNVETGEHLFLFDTWQEAVKGLEDWLEQQEHAVGHYAARIEKKTRTEANQTVSQ